MAPRLTSRTRNGADHGRETLAVTAGAHLAFGYDELSECGGNIHSVPAQTAQLSVVRSVE